MQVKLRREDEERAGEDMDMNSEEAGLGWNRLKWHLLLIACTVSQSSQAWAATNLPFGQTQAGTISSAAQTNIYTFSANTGDVIDFTLVATSGSLHPHIQVFTSNGTMPFASAQNYYNFACQAGPVELNSVPLPVSPAGTYNVWINDCGNTNTGNYTIYAQRTKNPSEAVNLSFAQTASGTINSAAQSNTYTFTGAVNDVLDFSTLATSGSLIPRIRLYNPDGSLNKSAENYYNFACQGGELEMNTVSLPAAGTYTLLFADCNDTNSGNYAMFVQSTKNPAGPATGIRYGQVQTGTVNSVAGLVQSNTYTFSATANDVLDITIVATSGSLEPRLRIYNPDGSLLNSYEVYYNFACQAGPLQINNVTLPTTGKYVALLDDCNHTNAGNYNLSSQCFGVCPSAPTALTWYLKGVTLTGGGSLTGSLVYDHDTQTLSLWSITSSPGAPSILCPPNGCVWTSATDANTVFGIGVIADTPTFSSFALGTIDGESLLLALAGQLTDAGGTVPMVGLSSQGCHEGNPADPGCVLNGNGPTGADLTGWLTTVPPGHIAGDFDGNGVPDIILQFGDGSMGVWYLGGSGRQLPITGFNFIAGPSSGIKLVDVGDLNGDGIPDVILRFTDGSIGVWYIGGAQRNAITGFTFISGPITGWMPVGMADLNGDGHLDLIIQSTNDGSIGVWYLGGTQGNQIQGFAPISGPIAGWKVVGMADLNNDTHPDMIIQYADGTIGVWYLGGTQGNQIQSFAVIAGPSPWSVVGSADLDQDGHADVLIRHTDGTLGVWFLGGAQGNQITGFMPLTGAGGANWLEMTAH